MVKIRYIIEGKLEGTGFAAYIKNIARNLNINGSLRYLDRGKVEIYCDANKEILNKFKTLIHNKITEQDDIFQIEVKDIKEDDESSKNGASYPN